MTAALLLRASKALQRLDAEEAEVRAAQRKWQARYAKAEAAHQARHRDWLRAQEAALLSGDEPPPEPRWEPPTGGHVFDNRLYELREKRRQALADEGPALAAQLEEREEALRAECGKPQRVAPLEFLEGVAAELEALRQAALAVHGAVAPGGPGVAGVYSGPLDAAKVVEWLRRGDSFLRPPAGILR